jgi:hypothetical protein
VCVCVRSVLAVVEVCRPAEPWFLARAGGSAGGCPSGEAPPGCAACESSLKSLKDCPPAGSPSRFRAPPLHARLPSPPPPRHAPNEFVLSAPPCAGLHVLAPSGPGATPEPTTTCHMFSPRCSSMCCGGSCGSTMFSPRCSSMCCGGGRIAGVRRGRGGRAVI